MVEEVAKVSLLGLFIFFQVELLIVYYHSRHHQRLLSLRLRLRHRVPRHIGVLARHLLLLIRLLLEIFLIILRSLISWHFVSHPLVILI